MYAARQIEETSFSFSDQAPSPSERRRQERHIRILRVGVLFFDGRRELCLIRNISSGGLLAHVYSAVTEGEQVTVELKTNQQVTGKIAWAEGSDAGIAFDAPVDIVELLANPPILDNGWKPRSPRIEVNRSATVRAGARTRWVRTRDISQSGVKIEVDQPFEVGVAVVVTLENLGPIAGVVRWQDGPICGIEFNQVIPFGELIEWLKRR
ncbi:MAG: PilZ domain-containing protein [Allosphingosinicella sp.]